MSLIYYLSLKMLQILFGVFLRLINQRYNDIILVGSTIFIWDISLGKFLRINMIPIPRETRWRWFTRCQSTELAGAPRSEWNQYGPQDTPENDSWLYPWICLDQVNIPGMLQDRSANVTENHEHPQACRWAQRQAESATWECPYRPATDTIEP